MFYEQNLFNDCLIIDNRKTNKIRAKQIIQNDNPQNNPLLYFYHYKNLNAKKLIKCVIL
jgi:hypothetical protein